MTYIDPRAAAAQIRRNLRSRSGKTWSVTLGAGTSWGWLTITAPPSRQIQPGEMGSADIRELAALLAVPHSEVHPQGILIPDSTSARAEYLARASGEHPTQQALSR